MNKIWMFAIAVGLTFGFGACKPKQSAYKAAYEKAQEKAVEEEPEEEAPVATPAPRPKPQSSASTQREKVRVISSSDNSGLKNFSVVIGSFVNKTNAEALKSRMEDEGYNVILAQNDRDMYRVIIATFDEKYDAAQERDRIKAKYSPQFKDAWLLEKN